MWPSHMPWHEGEMKMHSLMHVEGQGNPTSPFLSPGAAYMVTQAPLLALGVLDEENRPWTTVLGGKGGFAKPVAQSILGINTPVDKKYDPFVQTILGQQEDDEAIQEDGDGRIMAGLTIDLETRMRIKLHGRFLAGVLQAPKQKMDNQSVKQMQLVVEIEQSLGNCPKYLNKKHIIPSLLQPKMISNSPQLPPQAIGLLEKADLFFISSSHGMEDMDTNHRGGPPGFVRLVSNEQSGAVIVYPEYSGNRLYQTLGNLQTTPRAGITVPDFDTGDVLYLTGTTEVLVGNDAASILPRSNLAVKVTITSARYIEKGLSFRGSTGERSPYNPAVRYASTEKTAPGAGLLENSTANNNHVRLVSKTKLTPTISRFRFKLLEPSKASAWKPGQYATLSFADDLDQGYSHMRDDDPKSLNDDYLRTFTISSAPSTTSLTTGKPDDEFDLTIRRVGRATDFLFTRKPGYKLPLKGFEGEFRFAHKPAGGIIPFIAGGIGITPVLGQLTSMPDVSQLRLLWSIGQSDIGLVADTLRQHLELIPSTTLFITGKEQDATNRQRELLAKVVQTGVKIERRRLSKSDVDQVNALPGVDEWYMCVGLRLKASVLEWLAGRRLVYEDFNY